MGKIHILDKSVSNMIAAGEVVSRPASAIKELIENSLDAGAHSITVEIKNGGITYMRVTDDGCGIDGDDLLNAFMPHATSKIKNAEDLEEIATYGFRGEALASIGAVSNVELISRTEDGETGNRVEIDGGESEGVESCGAPLGTTIVVKNLFYNTPARFKFLKKDSAETAAVTDVCQKAALSRPDVSFRYISGGKEIFFTPGNNVLLDTIFAVFGKDFAKHMILVNHENNGIKVWGFIGSAAVARPNRNMQIFFVNGRPVVNRILSVAITESFKNQLTVGKFPTGILNISIDPRLVDVNVHPAKIEVKFVDEHAMYDAIYWGCKGALYEKPYVPEVLMEDKKPEISPAPVREAEKREFTIKEKAPSFMPQKVTSERKPVYVAKEDVFIQKREESTFNFINPEEKPSVKLSYEGKSSGEKAQIPMVTPGIAGEAVQQELELPSEKTFKIVGQVFDTYIIAQSGNEMLMIDQHAAHERLNFEKIKKNREEKKSVSQMLLLPELVSLTAEEMAIWEENKDFFMSIGFETEVMGESEIMVRTIPSGTEGSLLSDVIVEIITILKDVKNEKRTYFEERAMYSVACKSAIKANREMSKVEQEHLVSEILSLEGINTCPHGRPVCIKMTKEKIEKEFKRI